MISAKKNKKMTKAKVRSEFIRLNCCIIIPTYNNCSTLAALIDELLNYTDRIIIVNDGSTDATKKILKKYEKICQLIQIEKNGGKGAALRKAFRYAYNRKYRYAITIDSDGQHLPSDLHVFLDKISSEPGSIIIGSRNMEQSHIPKKSSFGNKFSNFWFKLETGFTLPDTQSGYRLYPLEHVGKKRYFTRKFEFEIEVLVRAAWNKINVLSAPIHVVYQDKEERVSHFRPFKDFSRISVLNTVFVIWAFLYIKPRDFILSLTPSNIKKYVKKNIFLKDEPTLKIVFSVAFGLFMGIAPVWGYQLIIAIAVASFLKLNKFIVIASAHISIPPFIPLIIFLSYKTGTLLLNCGDSEITYSSAFSFSFVKDHLFQYVIGSLVFGFAVAIAGGILCYIPLKIYRHYKY